VRSALITPVTAFLHSAQADARGIGQRLVAQVHQITRPTTFIARNSAGLWLMITAMPRRCTAHAPAPQGDTQRGSQAGLAALCITAAGDHGEVGARADDGEQGETSDGDEFGHERLS
jgi:hypothetical protein